MTFCSGQNAESKCYTWEGLEFLNIFQFYEGERYFAFIVIPILDLALSFHVSCDEKIHAPDFDQSHIENLMNHKEEASSLPFPHALLE